MPQRISQLALVVDDYDTALAFYVDMLGFELLEDTDLTAEKRWVRVRPTGDTGAGLLLAKAKNDRELAAVGNQTGGRVFLFLETDNLDRDYQNLLHHDIEIIREPSTEEYGRVCVFADLYGNLWDLIQPGPRSVLAQPDL